MTQVKMPASLDEAVGALGGIDRLLQAQEWERAAIVATFVRLPGSGAHNHQKADNRFLSPNEFAALGINGLRNHETVRMYVRRWVELAGQHPQPGEKILLPNEKWPPADRGTDGYDSAEGAERTISKIIDKHGATPLRNAIGNLPREKRAEMESELIESAIENIGAPFDTPPPIPDNDRPLRTGYAVTEACDEFTRSATRLIAALRNHKPLEDPVADRAVDGALDVADQISAAIRDRLGIDVVTNV